MFVRPLEIRLTITFISPCSAPGAVRPAPGEKSADAAVNTAGGERPAAGEVNRENARTPCPPAHGTLKRSYIQTTIVNDTKRVEAVTNTIPNEKMMPVSLRPLTMP